MKTIVQTFPAGIGLPFIASLTAAHCEGEAGDASLFRHLTSRDRIALVGLVALSGLLPGLRGRPATPARGRD